MSKPLFFGLKKKETQKANKKQKKQSKETIKKNKGSAGIASNRTLPYLIEERVLVILERAERLVSMRHS